MPRIRESFMLVLALSFASIAPTGCGNQESLTIFSGRSEAMVGPLFERFERETGIKLHVVYDRTPALASRLTMERETAPADVFFAQDPGYLGAMANAGMLADLPHSLLEPVHDSMRDSQGRWVGTSGRIRVLTYNPDRIAEQDLPDRLEDLAQERFDSIAWAPGNGSLHAHVSALRHLWGDERTRAFLAALRDKGSEQAPRFDSNRPQVSAVAAGDVAMAWVNHYYLHALGGEEHARARNHSFQATTDAGNVMMVAGAGILRTSRNQKAARTFLEFLISPEVQEYFAQQNFEYPTRRGIDTHPSVRPMEEISFAEVDQAALADVGPTQEMLRELGLQ